MMMEKRVVHTRTVCGSRRLKALVDRLILAMSDLYLLVT